MANDLSLIINPNGVSGGVGQAQSDNPNATPTQEQFENIKIEIDKTNGLLDIESLTQLTGQPKEIFYGSFANSGNAEITDNKNIAIAENIEKGFLPYNNVEAEIRLNGNVIQKHIITDSEYTQDGKFRITLSNKIEQLENIIYAGFMNIGSASLYTIVVDAFTQIGYSDNISDILDDQNIVNRLQSIIYTPAFVPSMSFKDFVDKVCEVALLSFVERQDGQFHFVDMLKSANGNKIIRIPNKAQTPTPQKDIIIKNKVDRVEWQEYVFGIIKDSIYDQKRNWVSFINEKNTDAQSTIENPQNILKEIRDDTYIRRVARIEIEYYTNLISFDFLKDVSTKSAISVTAIGYKKYSILENGEIVQQQNVSSFYCANKGRRGNANEFVWNDAQNGLKPVKSLFDLSDGYGFKVRTDAYPNGVQGVENSYINFLDVAKIQITVNNNDDYPLFVKEFNLLEQINASITENNGRYYVSLKIPKAIACFPFRIDRWYYEYDEPPVAYYDVFLRGSVILFDKNGNNIYETQNEGVLFDVENLTISVNGEKYTVSLKDDIVYKQTDGTNGTHLYSLPQNELIQQNAIKSSATLGNYIASELLSHYEKGLSTAKITVAYTDFYDMNGDLAISKDNGEMFKLGDIVVVDKDNNGTARWQYSNGSPIYWKITGVNVRKQGVLYIDLELKETVQE